MNRYSFVCHTKSLSLKDKPDWMRRSLVLALGMFSAMAVHAGEIRVFTDNQGRIFRGELESVNGQFVTIKREPDGQTFTLKASNFSPVDMAYFKQHGLKDETPAPATVAKTPATPTTAPGTAATDAPLRVSVKVYPKTTERPNGRSNYSKIQKTTYKIELRNDEYKRELGKTHAIIMTFAKVLRTPDQTQVVGREEFNMDALRAAGMSTHETEKIVETWYENEFSYGIRYSGYLLVVKDDTGAVVNVSASSETLAKHSEELLKLKPQNLFDHNFKKSGEGSTYSNGMIISTQ